MPEHPWLDTVWAHLLHEVAVAVVARNIGGVWVGVDRVVVVIEGGGKQRREWWLNVDQQMLNCDWESIASYGNVSAGESWVSSFITRTFCWILHELFMNFTDINVIRPGLLSLQLIVGH